MGRMKDIYTAEQEILSEQRYLPNCPIVQKEWTINLQNERLVVESKILALHSTP